MPDTPEAGTVPPAAPSDSLWHHRDFMLLWVGQTVSETGSAVTMLALPLTAVVVLKASTFQVGLLTSATTLVFALIALPAGVLVDRLPKHRVMIWSDAARLLIIASIPVAAWFHVLTMAQLYVVALVAGVWTVFFDVAYQSYLPGLLRREHLMDGNSKLGVTQSLAALAGPGLGGGLVGAFGAAAAMTADAASYALSVTSLLAIRTSADVPVTRGASPLDLRAEIAEGLSFVFRHPILRKIVACSGAYNLFFQVVTAIQVVFLVRVLRVPPAFTGLILATGALGGIAGGLLAGRIARWVGSARLIWFSIVVCSAPQMIIPLAHQGPSVALFSLGYAVSMFSGVLYNVAQLSYRQSVCPPELLGRMNAAVRWIVWGTLPVGGLVGGVLGTVIGVRPTLLIGLAGSWAAGFLVFFSPLRAMRDMPESPGP